MQSDDDGPARESIEIFECCRAMDAREKDRGQKDWNRCAQEE
jgi:hypothetical protein